MQKTNFFLDTGVAGRYARARPRLNSRFSERLVSTVGRVDRALDLACGTGISTEALAPLANVAIGVDASLAMITHAERTVSAEFCVGVAEALPFRASSFDMVTVGLAIHWFERNRFYAEVSRVLADRGWLFVYNTWFDGSMRRNPAFDEWCQTVYLERYPNLSRDISLVSQEEAAAAGFTLVERWSIEEEVRMSPELLTEYLTTQSNVSAGRARRGETMEQATAWILRSVRPLFEGDEAAFPFGGTGWLFARDRSFRPGMGEDRAEAPDMRD